MAMAAFEEMDCARCAGLTHGQPDTTKQGSEEPDEVNCHPFGEENSV